MPTRADLTKCPCRICGKESDLKTMVLQDAPLFWSETNLPIKGWACKIISCQQCVESLGKPLRVIYMGEDEKSLCEFEKSTDLVVLEGERLEDEADDDDFDRYKKLIVL
jgi:hypothetical protein